MMHKLIGVLYKESMARYEVESGPDGDYIAHLWYYQGASEQAPPEELILHKEGRDRADNLSNEELCDELGYALELSQLSNDLLYSPRKKDYE